jgi:iron complex outermembrane receptor protein
LSAARAFRGPAFLESYMRVPNESPLRGVSAFGIGNENLDPESITSVELGYQNQESDYFTLETNVYFNLVKDAILLTDIQRFTVRDYAGGNSLAAYQPNDEAFPVSQLKFANERATFRQLGAELGIRLFPVQGLDYYANYSIHDTRPTDKDKVDDARAEEAQTSRHKFNTGIQYRADFGLELSADYSWTSKQVWVEQVIDTDRGVRWEDFGIKSLSLLNARIGWRLLSDRLELGFVGTNLTNQKQRVHPLVQPLDTRYLATAKVWF